jgi:hypothetical protein
MLCIRTGIILLLCIGSYLSKGQDAGFETFIDRLSDQYKVDVAIAPELIPVLDSIRNVGVEITSVQELLSRLLNHSGITYQIMDGNKLMLRRENSMDERLQLSVLTGTVFDQQSKEPIPYATVLARNANAGCITDERGQFILPVTDTTGYININYLGYTTISIPISSCLKGNITVNMEINEIPLEEILVVVPYRLFAQNYESQSTGLMGYQFITKDQLLTWNTERLITSLTAYTHFSANEGIRIRGSDAYNSLVIIDDIPVYDPYHFYNIFGPFNGHYFSSVEIYKNNFPIEYGGRIDGLIHAKSTREEPMSGLILDTDLLQSSLTTELKISPKAYLTAGGRVSHTGILNSALQDSTIKTNNKFMKPGYFQDDNEYITTQKPTSEFYDINLGLGIQPGTNSQISLHFFDSRDQLDNTIQTSFEAPSYQQETIYVEQSYTSRDTWKNLGMSAAYTFAISDNNTFHFQVFQSMFDKEVNYTSVYEEMRQGIDRYMYNTGIQQNELTTVGGKGFMEHKVNNHSGYTYGIEYQAHQVNFTAQENSNTYLKLAQKEMETSLFGEYTNSLWHKVNWAAGSRFTYLQSTSTVYVLPNLRLDYALSKHYSIRSSFSKNLQSVRALTVEDRYGRELQYLVLSEPVQNFPVLKSNKYMLGAGYSSTFLSIDVELYYKQLDGLSRVAPLRPDPSHDASSSPDDFYRLFTGDGKTTGIDVTVLYKKKKIEASFLYTLSKLEERYEMLFNGDYFLPEEDRRHQVKASGIYTLGKFRISSLVTYKSEAPYVSLVRLDGRDGIGMVDYNSVQKYLPAYFSLDLGLEYSFSLFKQPAMIGFTLINASNHENIDDLQHIGKVNREGKGGLFVTSQTALLGRTANVLFRYLID